MNRMHPFLARAVGAAALAGMFGIAGAGPLEPPAGPVAPTMKTLSEVEARTPIHQSDLPLSISVDGSYYLAEDLYASQDGVDMITVLANSVSIDLNGFTIHGTNGLTVASDCIQIESDVRTFSLTNGVIRGCGQYGVVTNFPFALTVSVDRVQANQNGQDGMSFGLGSFGVITRSVAKSNAGRGMLLAEGVIRECAAFSNGTIGLQISYGTINGCVARSNTVINALVSSGGTVVDTYAP
jgi:hypothetical protein